MKNPNPAWSAIVVVAKSPDVLLAVTRGFDTRDVNFPGGDAEPSDVTPADTAQRELYEETGLRATRLRLVHQWPGDRGQVVYAFVADGFRGRLRASAEGKPFWTNKMRLLGPRSSYRLTTGALLRKLRLL